MEIPKIEIGQGVYCYNVDQNSKCMAFKNTDCKIDCPAKITSKAQLLNLYKSLVKYNYLNQNYSELYTYRKKRDQLQAAIDREEEKQILAAWNEDKHRGSRGGFSESDSNSRASIKQKLKDNRLIECKLTRSQREEIKIATEKWEQENGKLPRLSRSILSRGEKK